MLLLLLRSSSWGREFTSLLMSSVTTNAAYIIVDDTSTVKLARFPPPFHGRMNVSPIYSPSKPVLKPFLHSAALVERA